MLWLLVGSALGATWTVATSGGHYTSISDAIDAASSGDTIEVAAGTWTESLDLDGKDLDIVGTAGSASTILRPSSGSTAVVWDQGEAGSLEGFTIRPSSARALYLVGATTEIVDCVLDGAGSLGSIDGGSVLVVGGSPTLDQVEITDSAGRRGGAIYAYSSATLTLTDVTISDPAASWGGAIFLYEADLVATSVVVERAEADYAGGAVYMDDAGLSATDLEVADAVGDRTDGAGLYLTGISSLDLVDGSIHGCQATSYASGYAGGAIFADDTSSLSLDGTEIYENTAYKGGGIALEGRSTATLVGVDFDDNAATDSGGALDVDDRSSASTETCAFTGNTAEDGAGVHLGVGASLDDTDSTWSSNAASGDGGGVHLDNGGVASFSGSVFSSNEATSAGGALYAIDVDDTLVLSDCELESNSADASNGGAIATGRDTGLSLSDCTLDSNLADAGHGGAISFSPASTSWDLSLSGVTLESNGAARSGGGIYAYSGGDISLEDCEWLRNSAGRSGGGLRADTMASVDAVRVLFHDNDASDYGGAWSEEDTTGSSSLVNGRIVENQADYGAGLALSGVASASLVNNTLVGNDAASAGAHLWVDTGAVEFVNNIFAWGQDGGGIYGDATAAAGSDFYYNDAWSNSGSDYWGSFSDPTGTSGNISSNPLLRDYSLDGDEANDDLRLDIGSPCQDTGDPSIFDVDGSASDMGAYGGPDADVVDADGDGSYDHADCDDSDATVYPGATETAYDGIDQDCSGADLTDVDEDGYDSTAVTGGDDCDDLDADVNPGEVEVWYDGTDADCDGWSDYDQDLDGYDHTAWGGSDCDDLDATVNPGATEIWYDGVDTDCSGTSDYDQDLDGHDHDAHGGDDCVDTDPDIHGGMTEIPYDDIDQDCDGADLIDVDEDGWAAEEAGGADCDDTDPSVNPGAEESWYDGTDSDCDEHSDYDADFDGHDHEAHGGDDCDDADDSVHPGARDAWYDGVDSNCDGADDYDQDADGWARDTDCNDTDATVYPGAPELENGRDDDCDGYPETADRDHDGLTDWEEWQLGTDMEDPDTDEDGLEDGAEVDDPSSPTDTDGDGRIDPLDADDDGDGISTWRETHVDADGDGQPDTDVDKDGTPNHLDTDTDGDGFSDADEGEEDEDQDGVPDYADYTGDYAGGGCTGGRSSLWLAPLALLFGRRWRSLRGRRVHPAGQHRAVSRQLSAVSSKLVALVALLLPGAALAGGLDAHGLELMSSPADANGYLRLATPARWSPQRFDLGLVVDYADRPLVEVLPDAREPVVGSLTTANLAVGWSPMARLHLDAVWPVHVLGTGPLGSFAAPGDARLGATWTAVHPGDGYPGVAVTAAGWLPTGADERLVGAPGSMGLILSASQRFGRLGWVVNAGARMGPTATTRNVVSGPGPVAGAGLSWHLREEMVLAAELTAQGSAGFEELPLEGLVSARARVGPGVRLMAGVGMGLDDAVGVPSWRVLVGLGWSRFEARRLDLEPVIIEVPGPGWGEEPEEPPPVEELPVEPEEPEEPPLAVLERDRIVVQESVFFREGRSRLISEAEPTLDAVAQLLIDHPEVEHLLVEGHTNHNGSDAYNLTLSQARAEAVVQWLLDRGIDPDRLLAKGYGFHRPLVARDHPDAVRINRRVEFTVLRSDEVPQDLRLPDSGELPPE